MPMSDERIGRTETAEAAAQTGEAEQQAEVQELPVRPEPQAGQYAMFRPEEDEDRPMTFGERMREIAALSLAMYSLLWKPVLCMVAGTVGAYLIMRFFLR